MTIFELNIVFEAAGESVKIGMSLKPNNHNKVDLVQIRETLCMLEFEKNIFPKNLKSDKRRFLLQATHIKKICLKSFV